MSLLVVDSLNKRFGGVSAAKDVSFSLAAGELLAVIGPNGAGKSTTFGMVGGQLKPDSGTVTLAGEAITGLPSREIWRKGVGRTFQVAQTFVSMTVAENVQMALVSRHRRTRNLVADASALHREEALALLDGVGMRADAGRPVVGTGLWRRQARRTRRRPGLRAEAPADGRAHRRHGPEGARGADGAHGPGRPRAEASACSSPSTT